MGKIVVKTFEEIDREWTPERIRALAPTVPSFHDDITEEDIATGRVRELGRGFAVLEKIMADAKRPKKTEKKAKAGMLLPKPVPAGV